MHSPLLVQPPSPPPMPSVSGVTQTESSQTVPTKSPPKSWQSSVSEHCTPSRLKRSEQAASPSVGSSARRESSRRRPDESSKRIGTSTLPRQDGEPTAR